jgi:hypothetical protein
MAEVTVRFVTDLPDPYRFAPTPFSLPGDANVANLNALLNELLHLGAVQVGHGDIVSFVLTKVFRRP